MAQGLNLRLLIMERFLLKEHEAQQYSPLNLAFIGDSVYDLEIKTVLIETANRPVNILQKKTSSMVKADFQAAMLDAVYDELTEEEKKIFRRGRNSKPVTKAKNADHKSYLKATGFEAVMGYLYLTDRLERMTELIRLGLERTEDTGARNTTGRRKGTHSTDGQTKRE